MGLNDPLDEKFWKDTWVAVAVHNVSLSSLLGSKETLPDSFSFSFFQTEIHRKVFRCIVSLPCQVLVHESKLTTYSFFFAARRSRYELESMSVPARSRSLRSASSLSTDLSLPFLRLFLRPRGTFSLTLPFVPLSHEADFSLLLLLSQNVSHAEKFNKPPAPDAVHGLNQVISIHGGPGTHGAGGGGSGGGAVGQGQGDGDRQGATSPTEGGPSRSKSTKRGGAPAGLEGLPLSGPTEGWNTWERERMEELLAEVRGHLGELEFENEGRKSETRESRADLSLLLFRFSRFPYSVLGS